MSAPVADLVTPWTMVAQILTRAMDGAYLGARLLTAANLECERSSCAPSKGRLKSRGRFSAQYAHLPLRCRSFARPFQTDETSPTVVWWGARCQYPAVCCPLLANWGKSRGRQRPSFLPHDAVYTAQGATPRIAAPARHAPPTVSLPASCRVQYSHRTKWRKKHPPFMVTQHSVIFTVELCSFSDCAFIDPTRS